MKRRIMAALMAATVYVCGCGSGLPVFAQSKAAQKASAPSAEEAKAAGNGAEAGTTAAPAGQSPVAAAPQLSFLETTALQAVSEKLHANDQERQQLMNALHRMEGEISGLHPGFRFDESTGLLVALPKKAEPATK